MPCLPALFVERLKHIIPVSQYESVLATFAGARAFAFRVNTLKMNSADTSRILETLGVSASFHPALPDVFIVPAVARDQIRELEYFSDGRWYWQAPSSLLPALVLAPGAGESVLDLCAAPGSKTTQMAALVGPQGAITAVEVIKGRFFKLKSVCALTGVTNVKCLLTDGRRFRPPPELFAKVLVDAPCSSEGRFDINNKKSFGFWSPHKIKEMAHKQKGLLLNAGRCVKDGGVLVYSTCTFAPEENETVVDWFLKKTKGEFILEAFDLPGVPRYPALQSYERREYAADLSACWRVLPDGVFSGFFMARLRKKL
ncbi:MAG: RsmB/NOP family class I SAM-dependent RNA methyltransferase [Candidatus Omnitrophica bacterium]|nr:RsmB/NOP family class I SAM-dependent RNA methyltransferase [Candidatus Omnitrophota bacterium]